MICDSPRDNNRCVHVIPPVPQCHRGFPPGSCHAIPGIRWLQYPFFVRERAGLLGTRSSKVGVPLKHTGIAVRLLIAGCVVALDLVGDSASTIIHAVLFDREFELSTPLKDQDDFVTNCHPQRNYRRHSCHHRSNDRRLQHTAN